MKLFLQVINIWHIILPHTIFKSIQKWNIKETCEININKINFNINKKKFLKFLLYKKSLDNARNTAPKIAWKFLIA